ncbi:MAG: DUF1592 domain-containing protein [Chthoniobacter sp.]|uniref:DUF1592 domain-containing protein n=1 Tax=Chthoniobacter sp. TaxID=2510640 RepID=UPI0032A88C48
MKAAGIIALAVLLPMLLGAAESNPAAALIEQTCTDCHDKETTKGGLDLTALRFDPGDRTNRDRWVQIHDRVANGEMPPKAKDLPPPERAELVKLLGTALHDVDHAEVLARGRGPMRRLNRSEYEHNLRDVLQLPDLDIGDMLPEDREGHHFNKCAETLDMSRVQLTAYLEAAETALRRAVAGSIAPPSVTHYQALATRMFQESQTFGNREAMFYAKDSKALAIDSKQLREIRKSGQHDPAVEMALFRSASWPYYGYPEGFIAKLPGEYRVRFGARAVLQVPGYELKHATQPVPMTFRARKPSGPDVSGDVRATGGIIDIQPEGGVYETTVRLRERETFEYSLLGLPVPLARNVNNGPPSYRYPPFPEGGQPGIAFQWIEIEGPIAPALWPPPSHRVLFDDLPIREAGKKDGLTVEVITPAPKEDARRLLRRFVAQAARRPVPDEALQKYEDLIFARLDQGAPFAEAMLAGYQAFLCSGHFLYLHEPQGADNHFAIAERLSHFLTNTRPDAQLTDRARAGKLRDATILRAETERLIAGAGFERFVKNFTDYWLNLRHVRRDEPDIRLYPEYRFDDYLVESMEQETRTFFTAMVRENLPASVLVNADFLFANDRLAQHYHLPPLRGSALRKVELPPDSPYGGLLTQAAILKVTANGTTTSPVVRGAWIMDRLIGEPPPPPPPSVPAVEPDIRGAKTIRDLLALHTKSKSCAACHAKFDPIGLALENFDILGGWRTRYRGLEQGERVTGIDRAGHDFAYTLAEPVDASGRLLDGRTFQNVRDLKAILGANPRQLARNLLQQFTLYSTGTPVRFSDRAEMESILDGCQAGGYRVRDLLVALVQSKIFLGPAGCHP